ncbi:MAG: NifB/NifX family molybdenum-iron cluster-binding protein [Bacteroidales bacterium]|nr:NifB/NifX family molybdenum-iron cluster-binding protein [Bacteroidales bacterium]
MIKIAIPTRDNRVDDHFGHCDHYTVFTIDNQKQILSEERLDSPQGCGCKSNIASVMQEMGITLMLAGNMGMGAFNKLAQHGIRTLRGCKGDIHDVLNAYLDGQLTDSAESCDHHDCGNHDHSHDTYTPVFTLPNNK